MKGLSKTNQIFLKGSSIANRLIAKVEYGTDYIMPANLDSIEQGIEGQLIENFIGVRIKINLKLMLQREDTDGGLDTEFLLNDFIPSKNKQYKEESWADYIGVVFEGAPPSFPLYEDIAGFADMELNLLSKLPAGDISTEIEEVTGAILLESGDYLLLENGDKILLENN